MSFAQIPPLMILRADASGSIGIGHVGRSLSLAEAWIDAGGRAILAATGPEPTLRAMAGPVPLEWLRDNRLPLAQDITIFTALIQKHRANIALLDSYQHELAFETAIRAQLPLIALDDLASRQHDCDAIIDTSLNAAQFVHYRSKVPADASLLLGARFVVLRRAFSKMPFVAREIAPVRRILVSFGGADPQNHSSAALEALVGLDLAIDLVLSRANPALPELQARVSDASNINLHIDTKDMAALMARADLALGSGGSTSWERCRAGLPTLMTIVADNQLGVANVLESAGIVRLVRPEGKTGLADALRQAIVLALQDGEWRSAASSAGMKLIDGQGGERFVAAIRQKFPALFG